MKRGDNEVGGAAGCDEDEIKDVPSCEFEEKWRKRSEEVCSFSGGKLKSPRRMSHPLETARAS